MDGKWKYELYGNDEWYGDNYDTKEEAIKAGTEEYKDEALDTDTFRVGQISLHAPHIDVDRVIDNLIDDAYEVGGEFAESWLNVTKEEKTKLEDRLNDALLVWLKEIGEMPNFGEMVDVEDVKI